VEVKGDELLIKNIIGERFPRSSKIVGSTKIEIKGQNVRIYGTSLDDVTQTAGNIRLRCKMRNKDIRIFQDGLYYEIE
jgi:large subunit ribosomal protein L6